MASRQGCVLLCLDFLTVDDQVPVGDRHITGEQAMDAVVLQQVCQRLDVGQVVDADHGERRTIDELTECQSANPTKSIDCNALPRCSVFCSFRCFKPIRLLNGQDACETHFIFVDAAIVDGHAERRQLDFVVEHASHASCGLGAEPPLLHAETWPEFESTTASSALP